FNSAGGAWPMADHMSATGECQAIVRFVRNVIKQVGCPGKTDAVVVWADPDKHEGREVLEAPLGAGGLNGRKKSVNGQTWYAALSDTPVTEGYRFHEGRVGLNNFEACLRFTHKKKTKYYGGGAGAF